MLSQHRLIERFREGAVSGSASHMFIERDVIYSYGHHFPLAVRREWGAGIRYLLNGDRYSVTTSSHQRGCITQLKPNVQVPFSALSAAHLTGYYGLPNAELDIHAFRPDEYHSTCKHCGRDVACPTVEGVPDSFNILHASDGSPMCPEAEGEIESHHVLGAVVLRHRDDYLLSSIDDQEGWRTRSYFLCLLPRPVNTVEEAFEALVPKEIFTARAAGLDVRRQGDIFLVESVVPTRQIRAQTERHVPVFETSHIATEARRVNGSMYVRGTLRHEPRYMRPQHAMLRLGHSWWKAVKNLAVASWNASGNVD